MIRENVKTLLFVTSSSMDSLFPFLFEFTKYWSNEGKRLLYISKSQIDCLPPSLGKISRPDTHILKLMQFMYLSKWTDLLYQLATIRIRRFQVSAIVIDNLADYFADKPENVKIEDHISCVCATLLFATLISGASSEPVALVCGYVSEDSTIDCNIIKNFFYNIWEVQSYKSDSEKTILKLSKISYAENNEIISFTYADNHELQFDKDRTQIKLQVMEILKKIFEK